MQSPNPKWMGKNNEEILHTDAYTKLNSENEHWQSEPPFPMPYNWELTIKKYARPKQDVHFNSKENILWIWE